ncbi:hypothetical protein [Comamonas sp. BIGb0124]|uniref:hypothetical protein n=1 Tax=Comamonas sp. BIGb0124 TaxID=2485130 RepID=UPI000F477062|nr:hypothetical protein [Comamonas sp. BIGb0124]
MRWIGLVAMAAAAHGVLAATAPEPRHRSAQHRAAADLASPALRLPAMQWPTTHRQGLFRQGPNSEAGSAAPARRTRKRAQTPPPGPRGSGGESVTQRDQRLQRECRGHPNSGVCLGYARPRR